jgi:hypothetical protein
MKDHQSTPTSAKDLDLFYIIFIHTHSAHQTNHQRPAQPPEVLSLIFYLYMQPIAKLNLNALYHPSTVHVGFKTQMSLPNPARAYAARDVCLVCTNISIDRVASNQRAQRVLAIPNQKRVGKRTGDVAAHKHKEKGLNRKGTRDSEPMPKHACISSFTSAKLQTVCKQETLRTRIKGPI